MKLLCTNFLGLTNIIRFDLVFNKDVWNKDFMGFIFNIPKSAEDIKFLHRLVEAVRDIYSQTHQLLGRDQLLKRLGNDKDYERFQPRILSDETFNRYSRIIGKALVSFTKISEFDKGDMLSLSPSSVNIAKDLRGHSTKDNLCKGIIDFFLDLIKINDSCFDMNRR